MSLVNFSSISNNQSLAFKGKNIGKNLQKIVTNKNLSPLEVTYAINNPLNRAIIEGRPKEEIMEHAIREAAFWGNFRLCTSIAEDFAKKAAKNGYKPQ